LQLINQVDGVLTGNFYHIGDVHLATAIHSGNQHVGYLAMGLLPTEAWTFLRLSLKAFKKNASKHCAKKASRFPKYKYGKNAE
jgi:hypothetical protein